MLTSSWTQTGAASNLGRFSLYAEGMTAQDHARLASALLGQPGPWVLTYDAHPDVLDLYPGLRVLEYEIPHSAHRGKVGTEYLVLSPDLVVPTAGHPLGKGGLRQVVS